MSGKPPASAAKASKASKASEEARQALAKENFNLKQSLYHLQAKLRSRAGQTSGAAQLQEDNIELEARLVEIEREAHALRAKNEQYQSIFAQTQSVMAKLSEAKTLLQQVPQLFWNSFLPGHPKALNSAVAAALCT